MMRIPLILALACVAVLGLTACDAQTADAVGAGGPAEQGASARAACKGCSDKDCACAGKDTAESGKVACVCARGKAGEPTWCEACDVGYVDGKKAGCPGCVAKALKERAAAGSRD
jgi:hypothetical protein